LRVALRFVRAVSADLGKIPRLSNTDLKQTSRAVCVPRTFCEPSTQRTYRSLSSSILYLRSHLFRHSCAYLGTAEIP
jgi:hypothetical protein